MGWVWSVGADPDKKRLRDLNRSLRALCCHVGKVTLPAQQLEHC